jgi:hypothetical protein
MNMRWHDLCTINELAASFAKREGVEALVLAGSTATGLADIKAHEDRSGLLSRHGDTIAGPRIDFDDLLLLQFVLPAQDKSRKIGAVLQVVDDHPIDLRSERS